MNSLRKAVATTLLHLILLSSFLSLPAYAYTFAVMPVQNEQDTRAAFQPLVDYLSAQTGEKIELATSPDFLTYWRDMRKDKFDLILDAAHLVDYRAYRKNHHILAKVKDQVSFSLVSTEEAAILDAEELVGKKIAALKFPSRGILEINKMFPDKSKRPEKVTVSSYKQATFMLTKGEVDAIMIPTPMLNQLTNLQVIQTTELWPHMGFTASSNVPVKVKSAIAKAMYRLEKTPEGQKVLESIGLSGFRAADHTVYDGYRKILGASSD